MSTPAHFFIFTSGNPGSASLNTVFGHITMNTDTETATGSIVFRANDSSWVSLGIFTEFDFDEDENTFSGTLTLTDVHGDSPLPEVLPFTDVPVGVIIPGGNNPELFIVITLGSPPIFPQFP